MQQQTYPMTEAGLEKLKMELKQLEMEKREQAKQRIKHARSFCDFNEDSEYEAALKGLASVEDRIVTIKYMIEHVEIVEKSAASIVEIGSEVSIIEIPDGELETYTIVGAEEADPMVGKVSYNSPIAESLLGTAVDNEVIIKTPGGDRRVKIVSIS